MSNVGNFNPEWGYLAPKPGFIRSARMALATGAIGVVAGMAVAVALVAHPTDDVSVAARTMAPAGALEAAPTSAVSAGNAAIAESEAGHLTALQMAARTADNSRDAKDLAAAESPSAVTAQRPDGVSALAEAPAVNDIAADKPSGPMSLSSPKKVTKLQQPTNLAALAEARGLRNDASEMSGEAAPAPSATRSNRKVQAARIRTAREDPNSRARENGKPFDFLSLLGRTILGANPSPNDQIR
jgi:hypothetical protein